MDDFLQRLVAIEDAPTETFELFSYSQPSGRDLGMVSPSSPVLEISVGGRDFNIKQSPGLLRSDQSGGTTSAAVWQTGVRVAQWISELSNPLIEAGILGPSSTVLEVGAGAAGLVSCVMAGRVGSGGRVIASDMRPALKLLRENIATNTRTSIPKKEKIRSQRKAAADCTSTSDVEVLQLDWEEDDVVSALQSMEIKHGVDVLVACDCVFNYALVEPFAQVCQETCSIRRHVEDGSQDSARSSTVCVIAQHLRQPEVFEQWLEVFLKHFQVWRLPAEIAGHSLGEGSGYVVHLAILR